MWMWVRRRGRGEYLGAVGVVGWQPPLSLQSWGRRPVESAGEDGAACLPLRLWVCVACVCVCVFLGRSFSPTVYLGCVQSHGGCPGKVPGSRRGHLHQAAVHGGGSGSRLLRPLVPPPILVPPGCHQMKGPDRPSLSAAALVVLKLPLNQ